jgi:serine/threonine-protein kinase
VTCPDPNEIAAFLEGQLAPEQLLLFEQHLDVCSECRQMVAFAGDSASSSPGPAPSPLATSSVPSTVRGTDRGPLSIGHQLDNYVILARLGAGGMGEVYLAKDVDLGRRAAIKVIRADRIGSSHEVDRFVREARVTARLNHPGIVTIYGIGRTEGTPYLALEYVEGETLYDRLRRGRLDAKAWVPIAKAVAEAAREAHRHLIVHGDLKPSNVLLGIDGRVRTLDFGLARFVRHGLSMDVDTTVRANEQRLSATGIQGTPAYMAPEQWDARPATPASDVWALGVLIFEMVSGHVPFTIAQVARGNADTSAACEAVREAGTEVPAVVEDLLVRCLDVRAEDRPTMHHVVDALGVLERALELPSLPSGELPWGSMRPPAEEQEHRSAPSAKSGPTPSAESRMQDRAWKVVLPLAGLLVAGGALGAWGWSKKSEPTEPVPVALPSDSGSHGVFSASVPVSAVVSSAALLGSGPAAPASSRAPSVKPPTTRPSATVPPAATRPPKPPLPSMRLAAIASLEDHAEEADRKAQRSLARQFRAMADKQLNDVERTATQMKSTEPADAASLLDYVNSARAYLRQRRAASGAL